MGVLSKRCPKRQYTKLATTTLSKLHVFFFHADLRPNWNLEMLRWFFRREEINPWHQGKSRITNHDENKQHMAPGQSRTETTLFKASSHTLGGEEGKLTCDEVEDARRKMLTKPLKKTNLGVTRAFSDP